MDLNGDGQIDVVSGVNDDFLAAFEQSPCTEKNLSIQLQGKNGNTLAAGARINVKFDNGTTRSVDVASGSGYLSQSTSLVNIAMPGDIKVDDIEVRWPDGTSKKFGAMDIVKKIEIQQ